MPSSATELDALIVAGNVGEARKRFLRLNHTGETSAHRSIYARLARRLGLPMHALRLLYPIVSKASSINPVPDEILAEYAASLTIIGANREARSRLSKIDPVKVPETLLFRAFCCFAQWDYQAAIPLLRQYEKVPTLTPYQKLVAGVNLAAALVHENDASARPLLASLISGATKGGYQRLLGNLLLISGELEVSARHFKDAYQVLRQALSVFADTMVIDRLLIEKWIVVARLYSDPDSLPITLREIEMCRKHAREQEHWETIRSLDFHQAIATQDLELARRVHYGTPHEDLQVKLQKAMGADFSPTGPYTLRSAPSTNAEHTIDLGKAFDVKPLRKRDVGYRFLLALSQDFYGPLRVAELHSILYPGEIFNPVSSPARIRKVYQRVNQGLKEAQSPLRVEIRRGKYALSVPPNLALILPQQREPMTAVDSLCAAFQTGEPIAVPEVTKRLSISPHKAARLVYSAHREGKLTRTGTTRAARYFKAA